MRYIHTNDNDMFNCGRRPSSYRKAGRYLHIFTMATVLKSGEKIPLNFPSGTILALRPTPISTSFGPFNLKPELHNENGDILLQIWFSTGCIIFNDRACRSIGDGSGKEQTMDMKGRLLYLATVSVHHYLTDSEFGRYQILLNRVTVYHFDKRFPGTATQISYSINGINGPSSCVVDVHQIDDLLPEERLALVPGR